MNISILSGRLTSDISVRSANNKSVATFTLAVDTYKDHTDFINCVAWEQKARVLEQYTHKGDKIGIVGRIQARKYEDKEGKTQYITEVVVTEVEFLQPKKKEDKKEEKSETFIPDDEFVPC